MDELQCFHYDAVDMFTYDGILLMNRFVGSTDITSYLINLQVVVQHEWSCLCRFEILEWEKGIGIWVGGGLGESLGDYFLFHSRLC